MNRTHRRKARRRARMARRRRKVRQRREALRSTLLRLHAECDRVEALGMLDFGNGARVERVTK